MHTILSPLFFKRPALEVAPDLLGKFIVYQKGDQYISRMINEVEAYDGEHDLACHARFGRTPRNEVMYGPPGYFYVYFVYGVHWMLNVVVASKGYPAALLIRGVENISGPARLTKAFSIDKSFNACKASVQTGLWFEDRGMRSLTIVRTPRIGVDYSGEWAKKPYRFILSRRSSPCLSTVSTIASWRRWKPLGED